MQDILLNHNDDATSVITEYKTASAESVLIIRPASGTTSAVSDNVLSVATAEGTKLDASAYSSAVSGKTAAVIDLRAADLGDDVTESVLKETGAGLYYLPSSSAMTGENIVVGGDCASYVVTDGKNAVIPSTFKAAEASYLRNMTNQWGTVCLPFDVKSDVDVQFYQLSDVDSEAGCMTFSPVSGVTAGTPAVFKLASIGAANISSTDVNIYAGDNCWNTNIGGDSWAMKGTMTAMTLAPTSSDYEATDIYYIASNKFWYGNQTFTITAYRGWFETTKAAAGAKASVFSIDAEGEDATGVNCIEKEDGTVDIIFDINGRKLSAPKKGINIINNKKILV